MIYPKRRSRALSFDGVTTRDYVDCGSDATIGDWTSFTFLVWIRPRINSNGLNRIFCIARTSDGEGKFLAYENIFHQNGIYALVNRATQNAVARASSGLLVPGTDHFVGMTYDETNGIAIFHGRLDKIVVEIEYDVTPVVGSGSTESDDTGSYWIGADEFNSNLNRVFRGAVSRTVYLNERLELPQIRRYQFAPVEQWPYLSTQKSLVHDLGKHGTGTQLNIGIGTTGDGTVTNAVMVPGVSLPSRDYYVVHPLLTFGDSDSRSAYIAGGASASDTRAAFIAGGANVSDSRAAYIDGGGTGTTDSRAAYIEGLTYFPFTEDFTGQADDADWRQSHWVTSVA